MSQNPHKRIPSHPHPNIPPHLNTNMSPHHYPSMKPQPICLCPHFTSSPIYAPYGVAHHPHIHYLGYLYLPPPSIIPSSMSPNLLPTDWSPYSLREMTEKRR